MPLMGLERKIAVFGAAFNPPHLGHIDVIEQLLDQFDSVLLVPSFAHAFDKNMLPFTQRLTMLEIILDEHVDDKSRVEISLIEQSIASAKHQSNDSPNYVYSYDVLHALEALAAQEHKPSRLTLIIGPDNAREEVWCRFYKSKQIQQEYSVHCVDERVSIRSSRVRDILQKLNPGQPCALDSMLGIRLSDYVLKQQLYSRAPDA